MRKRVVHLNSWHRAMAGAMRLNRDDAERQIGIVTRAIDALLLAGDDSPQAWESLAYTSNVAEQLSRIGIGRGIDATLILQQAQEALAYVMQERRERGTWALRGEDRIEIRLRLDLLRDLHRVQLATCSYTEFERAYLAAAASLRRLSDDARPATGDATAKAAMKPNAEVTGGPGGPVRASPS